MWIGGLHKFCKLDTLLLYYWRKIDFAIKFYSRLLIFMAVFLVSEGRNGYRGSGKTVVVKMIFSLDILNFWKRIMVLYPVQICSNDKKNCINIGCIVIGTLLLTKNGPGLVLIWTLIGNVDTGKEQSYGRKPRKGCLMMLLICWMKNIGWILIVLYFMWCKSIYYLLYSS